MTIEELRNTKRAEILRLAARRGARNLRVFGSVARGENDSNSDIDFLVDLESGRSLLDLGGLQRDLEELLACGFIARPAQPGARECSPRRDSSMRDDLLAFRFADTNSRWAELPIQGRACKVLTFR
jgi:predicted nucleotidyltransferase